MIAAVPLNSEATSGLFARKGVLNLDGLQGSGADWLERFKPYIEEMGQRAV
jgi:hypothetical protein